MPRAATVAAGPPLLRLTHCPTAGSHGGNHVEVEGSFDNWTTRQPLQRSGKDFTIIKLLPPGVYQVRRRWGPGDRRAVPVMGRVVNWASKGLGS